MNEYENKMKMTFEETIDYVKRISSSAPEMRCGFKIACVNQNPSEIVILKTGSDWAKDYPSARRWRPLAEYGISSEHTCFFNNLSECKIVADGDLLICCASGGGVALIDAKTMKTIAYDFAGGNTHSCIMLPDSKILTASSSGNYLALFDFTEKSEFKSVKKYYLEDAHGIVYDDVLKCVWALGAFELVRYAYSSKNGLEFERKFLLPDYASYGHDLLMIPGSRTLLSTGSGIAAFDIESGRFEKISSERHIKSLSFSPDGTAIAALKVREVWWSDAITFLSPGMSEAGVVPNGRFYKARFLPA